MCTCSSSKQTICFYIIVIVLLIQLWIYFECKCAIMRMAEERLSDTSQTKLLTMAHD